MKTHFQVTYGEPFRNFRDICVFVDKSELLSSYDHIGCPTIKAARDYAVTLAKENKGKVVEIKEKTIYKFTKKK